MVKKAAPAPRREDSLSRDRIVDVAIELLDAEGESGLTFRALAGRLATGPGAIYWHVANKGELLTAACDAIVGRTMTIAVAGESPETDIRALALGLFDAIDAHPWVGSALTRAPGQLPAVRILEGLGQALCALDVPAERQWPTVSALLSYILGVAGQNAANAHVGRTLGTDRLAFLSSVAATWSELDEEAFPFVRSMAGPLREHDDRADFLAGIDLILGGVRGRRGVIREEVSPCAHAPDR
ncbi:MULTISPECIES: TetR/AcrR family transcriptional regulator [Luteibacter]|uniref:TetR/AcrR family transcriptional regulator n=1 Tax=Luteibacter TaxID=242605 RepID=UPI00055CA172|nr:MULTISPECIES: TetR family transcriptional regulator [unclassified Luteibacter]MDR6641613.1 AcrR family transcriptional regulator [Luteibacter sp. 1214]